MASGSIGGTLFLGRLEAGRLGTALTLAGDLDGDGIADFAFGAPFATRWNTDGTLHAPLAGEVAVVFGTGGELPPLVDLASLSPAEGFFLIEPDIAFANLGAALAGAGDTNGDGRADLLIGAPRRDAPGAAGIEQGAAFLLFGPDGAPQPEWALADLGPSEIWSATGAAARELTGLAVAGAGDLNGDGLDDILVGQPGFSPGTAFGAGAVAVVYGSPSGPAALDDLDGKNGFLITGAEALDQAGAALGPAGDVNADGIPDVIIGAPGARGGAGDAYVIYGSDDLRPPVVDLAAIGGAGTQIGGAEAGGLFGAAVAGLGDIDGDGINDLAIGAPDAGAGGQVTILAGRFGGLPDSLSADALPPDQGVTVAADGGGAFGSALAGVGDVNGDGIDDLAVGDFRADFAGRTDNGAAYLIFGVNGDLPAVSDPASLDGRAGYVFFGAGSFDNAGASLAAAGDTNGDGFADFMIGADGLNRAGAADAGGVYLIYGGPARLAAQDALDGSADGRIDLGLIGQPVSFDEGPATVRGTGGDDRIAFASGNRIVRAGHGDDTVLAGSGDDVLHGAYGDDLLTAGAGADTLFGWRGADILDGGAGDDWLQGGEGDDSLTGGSGDDRLTGGRGADVFTFGPGSGADRITDFAPGVDKVRFNGQPGALTESDLLVSDGAGGALVTLGADSILFEGLGVGELTVADLLL